MTHTPLSSIADVLAEFQHCVRLRCPGTLAQQIARQAMFGDEVMRQCTPFESREYRTLF